MNELDAAVNINLETRELNPKHRSLNVVRLGTSGALQADIPVNRNCSQFSRIGTGRAIEFL